MIPVKLKYASLEENKTTVITGTIKQLPIKNAHLQVFTVVNGRTLEIGLGKVINSKRERDLILVQTTDITAELWLNASPSTDELFVKAKKPELKLVTPKLPF